MNESWIPLFIDWAIPSMLILSALYMASFPLLENVKQRQYHRLLKQLSIDTMHDVVVENDLDGYIYIDHLLLLPGGIYVVQLMNFSGTIFAGESIDFWTQVLGKRSYKFPNPLCQVDNITGIIKALADTNKVNSWLVFSDECQFPKGKPDHVSTKGELKNDLSDFITGEVPASLKESWQMLKQAAQKNKKQEGNNPVRGTGSKVYVSKLRGALILTILACGWIVWRKVDLGI